MDSSTISESVVPLYSDTFDVILASPKHDQHTELTQITGDYPVHISWVRTADEALDRLRVSGTPVLLTARMLPDSDWKDLLIQAEALNQPPSVIVLSDRPDSELWMDVLNNGGFEVLSNPLRRETLLQTLKAAYCRWRRRSEIRIARKQNAFSTGGEETPERFRVA